MTVLWVGAVLVAIFFVLWGIAVGMSRSCRVNAYANLSGLLLCPFAVRLLGWVLLSIARSDPGILPRACAPYVFWLSVYFACGLLSPLVFGLAVCRYRDKLSVFKKLVGVMVAAFMVFAIAAAMLLRCGAL